MKSKTWTSEEIETIKTAFIAGKLVKTIADEVGRSQTAVNKFLSRSGIRKRRWSIEKDIRKQEIRKPLKKPRVFEVSRTTLNKIYTNETQVDFCDVIQFLRNNGYSVMKNNSFQKMFYSDSNYLINNKPVSGTKLLLFANRLRSEMHQPIFSVPDLIW